MTDAATPQADMTATGVFTILDGVEPEHLLKVYEYHRAIPNSMFDGPRIYMVRTYTELPMVLLTEPKLPFKPEQILAYLVDRSLAWFLWLDGDTVRPWGLGRLD